MSEPKGHQQKCHSDMAFDAPLKRERRETERNVSVATLDILLLLLPFRLVFDDLTPIGGLHIDDERLFRRGLAPTNGIADGRMILAHGDRAVGAEWRVDFHAGE